MSAKENNIKDTQLCVNMLRRPRNIRQALLLFALLLGFGLLANSCEDTSEATLTPCPENLTAPVLNATAIKDTYPDLKIGWTLPSVSCDYTLELYLRDSTGLPTGTQYTGAEIINGHTYKFTYPKGTTQADLQVISTDYFVSPSEAYDTVILLRDASNSSNTAVSNVAEYTSPS